MDKKYETRDITGRSTLRSRKTDCCIKMIIYTISNGNITSIRLTIVEGNILEFKALDKNLSPKNYKRAYMKIPKEGS